MTVNLGLLVVLLSSIVTLSHSSKSHGKRFIDEQKYNSDQNVKTLVDNNNGVRVPPGYHSYSVIFMKKPNFDKVHDQPLTNDPKDFSLNSSFFASGTILNTRWVLTRAKPIAYYSKDSYWIISQQAISTPVDEDFLKKHEADFVLIHPEHQPGDPETDVALVRMSKPFEFNLETRSADLGFDEPPPLENCKAVVWSWFFEKDDKKVASMERGEVSLNVKNQDCPELGNNSICLSSGSKQQPCGINSGAPIVCGAILVGIYTGTKNGTICEPTPSPGLTALRVDQGQTLRTTLQDTLSC
ncbi:hypothetical protein Zmor_022202 [Zophobas morio]|uniref:Peptidase S1 domain-containing protein n=1 Tax=Zophobas morio TaxID=2755281 RepID=A0AA38HW04_9CUCU|nr:hypothetical protein Zmor_022202 [Zophobas morio]